MKHLEIERRYLLYPCSAKRLLRRLGVAYEKVPMRQFYLVADRDRAERYRQEGDRYVRTVKRGSGLAREEEEEPIGRERFEAALAQNRGGIVVKNRYIFEYEGHRYELDAFKGRFKGLVILEIEFPDTRTARAFSLPGPLASRVVAEVTEDPRFTNGALSRSGRIPAIESDLARLLARIDNRENFLKASTDVPLSAFESGRHAVKALLYTLTRSVEANREAILSGDDDPERLHQLRVAMRKERALLAQLASLFDEGWAHSHKRRLAELMRETGAKRDLDVYLGQIETYRSLLESRYHEGIGRLEAYLRSRYEAQERALLDVLRSDAFVEEVAQLKRFCRDDGPEGLDEKANAPVVFAVKKALKKRYQRVLKKGAAIDAESPAHLYHALRIEVKKLRYLMEFFAALFEPDAYGRMLKRVKKIQSVLGDHQDLEVQRAHLKAFAELEELHDAPTRRAIEALRKVLASLEEKRRREFRSLFAELSGSDELFSRMICHG